MMTLEKFEEAYEVVQKVILQTKLVYSDFYSDLTGNKVYIKPENMQKTGAYKIRGAYYKISTLTDEEIKLFLCLKRKKLKGLFAHLLGITLKELHMQQNPMG